MKRRVFIFLALAALATAVLFAWHSSPRVALEAVSQEPQLVAPLFTGAGGSGIAQLDGALPTVEDCCPGAVLQVSDPAGSLGLAEPMRVPQPVSIQPLTDFQGWAQRYAAASADQKPPLVAEGLRLALGRHAVMAGLIKYDPKKAIESILPYALRKGLPPEIAAKVEQRVSGRGDLMVLAVRPMPGQTVEEPIVRTAKVGEKEYRAYIYGKRETDISRKNIPILGVALEISPGQSVLAVREEAYEVLENEEAADIRAAAPLAQSVCPISGDETESKGDETGVDTGGQVLWLCSHGHIGQWLQTPNGELVAAAGGTGTSGGTSPVMPATYTEGNKKVIAIRVRFSDQASEPATDTTMQTELQKVVNQWAAWSYGKLQAGFSFTPTLILPQTESWYAANGTDNAVLSAARTAAAAYTDGTGAKPYDPANFDFDCVVFSSGQIGNYCGLGYVGGKGAWIKCTNAGTYLHEWGHNLGLWHSNYLQPSTDSPIGPGTHVEYGNNTSTMGSAGLNPYDTLERYTLHWLESTDVATINASGTYRLYNADKTTLTSSHPYAARIYKGNLVYYVEYRPNWDPSNTHSATTNGVMICWTQQSDQLLDMTPLSSGGASDASLLVGRSFTDPGQGLTVTAVTRGGTAPDDYIDVVINYSLPTTNSGPVAVITASSQTPNLNTNVTLAATASDPNGNTLAYSWDFDDGNVSTNNLPMQTKSWSTAGDYTVRCTVSDMRGKTTVKSLRILVGTPGTYTIGGRVTQEDGTPVQDVLIADTANHLTYTDSEGNYALGPLPAGSYSLSAMRSGWTLTASTSNPVVVGPNAVNVNFTGAAPAASGGFTLEHWDNIPGELISNLTSNPTYPNYPTYITSLESVLEAPDSVGDNYGQRVRGWFRPPTTGTYNFYIASDDNSELYLSTNDTATSKVKIASVTGYTNSREWTKFASQKSAAIALTAGKRYYLEALHKEGGGGDNLAVGADFPGAVQHRPLEVSFLDPIGATIPSTPSNSVTVTATDASASEAGLDPGTFTLTRTGALDAELTVYFDLGGSASYGSDYQPTGVSVVFATGSATSTVTITPKDDSVAEVNETVVLTLASSLDYTIGAVKAATVTILDDEAAAVTIAATDSMADESGSNPGVFTVTRTGDTSTALTVNLLITGSATNGSDYPTAPSTITIPAEQDSAMITIAPTADNVSEVEETVVFTLASGTGYSVGAANTATVRIAGSIGTGGGILREWWDNISNTNYVYDLTNLASYPNSPTGREIITTAFTTVENRTDNFGERWRGLYTAPVSGSYRFYIASDDYSELWLSTDATPQKRQKIASVSGSTGYQNWTQFASQQSVALTLIAGQRYYIESIFKEGGGGDHMSVGVEYPNGALERPIPAHRLDPYTAPSALPAGWFSTGVGATGATGAAGLGTAPLTAGPRNRYSFSGPSGTALASGTSIPDSIGGASATLRGAGAAYSAAGNGIDLPGGSSATQAYIDLPNGVITGTNGGGTRYTSATFEAWVTVQSVQTWSRLFDFGTGSAGEVTGPGGSYSASGYGDVFLTANLNSSNDQRLTRTGSAGTTAGTDRDSSGTTVLNSQVHLAVTYDGAAKNWRWYRNGVLMQVLPDTEGLSTLTDVNNWLGRSAFNSDANADALYSEFRIYNYALNEAQLRGNYAAGPDVVNTENFGNGGPFLVSGSGAISTNGVADAFQFTGQTLAGDWDVRARLAGLTTAAPSALAGLMMREGANANARHSFIGVSPDGTGQAIARLAVGGNSVSVNAGNLALPQWLRLVRTGNSISSFVSADGSTWAQVGATTTFVDLSSSVRLGLAVASGTTANSSALAQFDGFTLSPAPGRGDGFLYERFEGIQSAGTIAALTGAPAYPDTPTLRERRNGFVEVAQTAPNLDNFGDRLRGYFVAPQSGSYTFYIAGDDQAELWLSANETSAARVRIASTPANSGYRLWTTYASQKSLPIALTAGQRYYLEVLHGEGVGEDHVSIGVMLPNGVGEFPMLASRLEAYELPKVLGTAWSVGDVGTPGSPGFSGQFLPGYTGVGDALPIGPRHRYSFRGAANSSAANGTTLIDTVSGQHATLRGSGATFAATGNGIGLPGGSSATQAYVDLPTGVVTGKLNGGTAYSSATYELWFTQRSHQSWSRLLDFGTNTAGRVAGAGGSFTGTNYVVVTADIGTEANERLERIGSTGTAQGTSRDSFGAAVLNEVTQLVLTYDASAAAWLCYRNGILMSKLPDTLGLAGLTDVNNWLGRSNFASDQNLDAVLQEFRIYNYALTPQQIIGNFTAGADVVNTIDNALPRAPRHRWTFSGTAGQAAPEGTWVYDKVGGANALIRGAGAAFNASGSGLVLPGGSSATQAYVDLPNGVISGTVNGGSRFTNVTLEAWTRQSAHLQNSELWSFGTGSAAELSGPGGTATGTNFLSLAANAALAPNAQLRRKGATTDVQVKLTAATVLNQLTHHVAAYDATAKRWSWYENGILVATLADTDGVSTLPDVNAWLGRSPSTADANWAGTMHEFRSYDYTLTADQVLADYHRGPDVLSVAMPGLPGSATLSGGGDISSSGTTDSFQFAAQTMDGNGEIIARVVSLQNVSASAKAGVMVRESGAAGARHAFIGFTPGGSGRFIRRATTGATSTSTALAGIASPLWVRLMRKGDDLSAYTSADGATWIRQGNIQLGSLSSDVLIGLAVSSSNTGVAEASFDNVQIIRPTVSITATQNAVEYPMTNGLFTISRTWDTTDNLTVSYRMGGSATAGSDYQALSGTIDIPVGVSSVSLSVAPINDEISKPLQTLSSTILDVSGYILGASSSATLTLDGSEGATETWQRANFGANWADSSISGDIADPDGDGFANLLERALGGNPNSLDAVALLTPSIVSGKLALTFQRSVSNSDLSLIVQGADALDGPWLDLAKSTGGASLAPVASGVVVTETGGGSIRSCEVRDLYLANDPEHPQRYLRLRVER